ncbi:GNAT family N-acetyltransferase [Sphingomonas sp.]|uniref:GNAT family N-acetyltransferase n=1 Tax=Sphingomonas sp. TaxID=28214 RepID=UPI003AFFC467
MAEHGIVAGYGELEPDRHIDHLYCRPDRLGTGVGSALYAGLEAAAEQAGIPSCSWKRARVPAAFLLSGASGSMPGTTSS